MITAKRACRVRDCTNDMRKRGLCQKHYSQLMRKNPEYREREKTYKQKINEPLIVPRSDIPLEFVMMIEALASLNLTEMDKLIQTINEPDWKALALTVGEVAHAEIQ